MRNVIFGAIGVLWGGAVIVSGLVNGVQGGGGAYGAGQFTAFLFGIVFFLAGGWTLLKRART